MDTPYDFLPALPAPAEGLSLGEQLAQAIAERPWIDSLLACLPSSTQPAILSTSQSRPPLTHTQLRDTVANFRLPSSSPNARLGPNDRIAIVLPTGPEVCCPHLLVAEAVLIYFLLLCLERPCSSGYFRLSHVCADECQLHCPGTSR